MTTRVRPIGAMFSDVVWLAFVVLVFPLGILLIGAPIAACVKALVAIAQRL